VDNTFATPYLQRPLEFGADIVVHSTTKYLSGHSDVIGGAIVTSNEELYENLKFYQNAVGAVPGPFDCFLILRGIKTLSVRLKEHCRNAKQIAEFLQTHPGVESVFYPGLPSHPQHELAKKQMDDFGGMVAFVVKGGLEAARELVNNTELFQLAESLGGVKSLICHPASMTHKPIPKEVREHCGISDGLIRLSIGLEDAEDLIDDLSEALDIASRANVPEKELQLV
jgi:cystathionine gamma-lyase